MSKRDREDYDTIEEPRDWVEEVLAAIVVAVFTGGATYRWVVQDSLGAEMTLVFLLTILAALATIFGVDRIKAIYKMLK